MFGRSAKRLFLSIFEPNHWKTLIKSFVIFENPIEYLLCYTFAMGKYPCTLIVRTPIGRQVLKMHRFEDIFTVTEIFLWGVYATAVPPKVFLDIGGNVGFASLYFLTRRPDSCGFLVEPLPQNILRAKQLLAPFQDRVEFIESAVSHQGGSLEIGVEPTGRYSGVDCLDTALRQSFEAIEMNDLLSGVYGSLGAINLVKIDCEGAEKLFMPKVKPENLENVSRFRIESHTFDDSNLLAAGFTKGITFDDGQGGYVFDFYKSTHKL